jgi:hypothetical protein
VRSGEVVTGDAALTDHYRGTVPADLVLACGLPGNVTDDDIRRTVGFCPQLTRTGAPSPGPGTAPRPTVSR